MKVTEAQFKRYVLLAFGIGISTWEIVVRHAAEPIVLAVMGAWIGFKPMVHLDGLFNKKPEPQTPAPEAAKEAVTP